MEIEKTEAPMGVKFSAGLLVVYGTLLGLSAVVGIAIIILLGLRIHTRSGWLSTSLFFSLYLLVLSAFSVACFRAASGLYQSRNWARYCAVRIGMVVISIGILILLDAYLRARPGSFHGDDGFAVLMSPFMIGPGLWLAVYLNLPHVSRGFRKLPGE
jgi:hypothetical protein